MWEQRLSNANPIVQTLFAQLRRTVETHFHGVRSYATDVPDWRFAQPRPGHVLCDVVPMILQLALRLNVRIDHGAIPNGVAVAAIAEERPGLRWVRVDMHQAGELPAALAILQVAWVQP